MTDALKQLVDALVAVLAVLLTKLVMDRNIKKKEQHSAGRFQTIEQISEENERRSERRDERVEHAIEKVALRLDPITPVLSALQERVNQLSTESAYHRTTLHKHGNFLTVQQKQMDDLLTKDIGHDSRLDDHETRITHVERIVQLVKP